MSNPIQRSPLYQLALAAGVQFTQEGGWLVVERYPQKIENHDLFTTGRGIALADESANGKLLVEGAQVESVLVRTWALRSMASGQGTMASPGRIYRLRPDQYLVHTRPGAAQAALDEITAQVKDQDGVVVVTNITHGCAELLLVGPDCPRLLSRLCGLNFDGTRFPDGAIRQSSVAKTRQIIIREDIDLLPAYRLVGARSLAVYLWHTIREAGEDLGLTPIGRVALESLR